MQPQRAGRGGAVWGVLGEGLGGETTPLAGRGEGESIFRAALSKVNRPA